MRICAYGKKTMFFSMHDDRTLHFCANSYAVFLGALMRIPYVHYYWHYYYYYYCAIYATNFYFYYSIYMRHMHCILFSSACLFAWLLDVCASVEKMRTRKVRRLTLTVHFMYGLLYFYLYGKTQKQKLRCACVSASLLKMWDWIDACVYKYGIDDSNALSLPSFHTLRRALSPRCGCCNFYCASSELSELNECLVSSFIEHGHCRSTFHDFCLSEAKSHCRPYTLSVLRFYDKTSRIKLFIILLFM